MRNTQPGIQNHPSALYLAPVFVVYFCFRLVFVFAAGNILRIRMSGLGKVGGGRWAGRLSSIQPEKENVRKKRGKLEITRGRFLFPYYVDTQRPCRHPLPSPPLERHLGTVTVARCLLLPKQAKRHSISPGSENRLTYLQNAGTKSGHANRPLHCWRCVKYIKFGCLHVYFFPVLFSFFFSFFSARVDGGVPLLESFERCSARSSNGFV